MNKVTKGCLSRLVTIWTSPGVLAQNQMRIRSNVFVRCQSQWSRVYSIWPLFFLIAMAIIACVTVTSDGRVADIWDSSMAAQLAAAQVLATCDG